MPALKGKPNLNRRKRVMLACKKCGSAFETHAFRAETARYCSKECRLERAHKTCEACGKYFGTVGHWGKQFCSKTCAARVMVGEKAAAWKGGISPQNDRIRKSWSATKWRKAVKERDGGQCQKCDATENLHAHHVVPYAQDEALRFDVANGITLCEGCHSKEHGRWIGKKPNKAFNVREM